MATTLSELSIIVRAKADSISADIEKGIRRAQGNFAAQGKVIGAALATGIAAGMATLVAAFKSGVKQIDDLSAAASKIGGTTSGLAELQFQAKMADASFEGLLSSMQKMSANIAAGGATSALGKLKLDAAEIRKMAPEQQFEKIREALRGINDVGARMVLGKEIFGKGFGEIVNLIKASAAETAEWNRIAKVVGLTISEEMVGSINEFDNATHVITALWDGFGRQLAGQIAPIFKNLSEFVIDMLEKWGGMASIVNTGVMKVKELGFSIAFCNAKIQEINAETNRWGNVHIANALTWVAKLTRALGDMVETTTAGFRGMTNQLITGINSSINAIQIARTQVPKFMGGIDSFTPSTIQGLPEGGGLSSALFDQTADSIDNVAESTKKLSQENMDAAVGARLTQDEITKAWSDQEALSRELINNTATQSQASIQKMVDVSDNAGKQMQVRHAQLVKDNEELVKDTNNAFSQMQSANRAVVTDMVSAWITGTGKMSDIINQWAQQSLKRIIDVLLFGTKGGAGGAGGFGGILGAVGGIGGGFGGAIGSIAGALFGGARAAGGPVAAGRSYVVGERGPEMFMPKQSGNIVPGGIRGGGGMITVMNITQNYAPGVSRVELAVIADQLQRETIAAVAATYEQGGSYRRRMKG